MAEHDILKENLREELRAVRLSQPQKEALKQQMLHSLNQLPPRETWYAKLQRFWHSTYEVPVPVAALCLTGLLIASSLSANLLDSSPVQPPAVVQIEETGANGVTTIRVIQGR